jgi:hypothetical protein
MSEKSSGVDFDRQVFVQASPRAANRALGITPVLLAVAAIVAIVFLGYKFLFVQIARNSATAGDPALADLDKRLANIEGRLDKLETARRTAAASKKEELSEQKETSSKPQEKTVYRISPAPWRQGYQAPTPTPAADPAMTKRLSALQSDQDASREAWQATTNKLADMAGQVGSQGVEILKSQDELNQLLARTEMEAIPFELLPKSNPQPVGPVSLVLKSTNQKAQRYNLCVYIQTQPSCIELKNRALHEVVQFVAARNTAPLEVVATKITKDVMLGYLEVPKSLGGR